MKLLQRFLLSFSLIMLLAGCGSSSEQAEVKWQTYSPALVAKLTKEGKPVFVEFSADWCGTCQANKPSLTDDAVVNRFNDLGVQRVIADWTDRDPALKAVLQSYGREGVPLYLLFDGKSATPTVLPKKLTAQIVLDHLNRLG